MYSIQFSSPIKSFFFLHLDCLNCYFKLVFFNNGFLQKVCITANETKSGIVPYNRFGIHSSKHI